MQTKESAVIPFAVTSVYQFRKCGSQTISKLQYVFTLLKKAGIPAFTLTVQVTLFPSCLPFDDQVPVER